MLPSTDASLNCLDSVAVWRSDTFTSGRHMASETDVCGVGGSAGAL